MAKEKLLKIIIAPTSCRCGGSRAYMVAIKGGPNIMIGCVCHRTVAEAIAHGQQLAREWFERRFPAATRVINNRS